MFSYWYAAVRRDWPRVSTLLSRVERSSWGSRLARGVFWSVVGAVISRLLALAAAIVAAQVLGKVAFGEFGMIQSTIQMFATFATFGVGLAATKYVAEFRERDPERAGRIIAMSYLLALLSGSAVSLVMIFGSSLVAREFLAAPHLAGIVALGSLALLVQVLDQVQIGALSGLEAFRRRSTLQAYGGIIAFPVGVVGVYYFGLAGAIGAVALSGAVLVLLNAWGIRHEAGRAGIRVRWQGIGRELGLVWRFNLPAVMSGVVYVPAMWLANLLLVRNPDGYAQMGLFSAADRWRTAIGFLPALLGGVALPMFSSMSTASDSAHFLKLLRMNLAVCCLLSVLAAVPIAALAPWIMSSYGPGFVEGKWVLVILCATAVMHAAYWILGQTLISQGKMWIVFRINLGWALVLVGTAWYLQVYGARGLAAAYLLADSFRLLAGVVASRRLLTGQPT